MYTAIGQKIGKEIYYTHNIIPEIVTYLDGFQYSFNKNGSGGYIHNMQFFPTAEGYVNVLNKEEDDGGSFQHYFDYVYNYTDHLGNVRLPYTDANRDGTIANYIDTSDGYYQVKEILEENNYYPFGLKHKQYNSLVSKYALTSLDTRRPIASLNSETGYQYKYNGKELQDELGLNVTAMDFRQYDNALGRFMSIDFLSEQYYSHTPYNFTGNNPIYFSDPSGMEWYQNNETGEYEYFDGTGERDGWTHVGSAVSYYDENTGNFVNGNTEYDEDGNEIGTTRDILDGDGNVLEQGYQVVLSDVAVTADSKKGGTYMEFGFTAAMPLGGIDFQIGRVWDSEDRGRTYLTLGLAYGLTTDIGFGSGSIIPTTSEDFHVDDFEGTYASYTGGATTPIYSPGYSYGGSTNRAGAVSINDIGKTKNGYVTFGNTFSKNGKLSFGGAYSSGRTIFFSK